MVRDIKGDLKNAGYSQEEAYFYRLNRELIQKIKKKFKLARFKKNARACSSESSSSALEVQDYKKAA